MKEHIIIVAAGKGSRFGGDLPKQFCLLGERPVLMQTIIRLGRALPNAQMAIVLSDEYAEYWSKVCQHFGFESPQIVIGGATRWESVKNAITTLNPADGDVVLVHDGVRPVIHKDMISRIMEGMNNADAVIPVMPLTETLRQLDEDGASHAIDRSKLVSVQTPQAFRAGKLKAAYDLPYSDTFTDDASVYEAAGYGVPALVEGSPLNIKITHPRDLEVAALYLGLK